MKTLQTLVSFSFFCFIFSLLPLRAQTAYGFKIGRTKAQVLETFSPDGFKTRSGDRKPIHFGWLFRTHFNERFYIQPELLYLEKGSHGVSKLSSGEYQETTRRFQSINVPVLLGAKLGFIQLAAGPEFEHIFKMTSKLDDDDYRNDPNFNAPQWNLNVNAEAAVQWKGLQLSLRLSRGFTPIAKRQLLDSNGQEEGKLRKYNIARQIALAYMLFN